MNKLYNSKSKINLIIDAIMLILLMIVAGLGLLIKYVLVPGFKRQILYDSDVELYYMGLTRHEWGSIHLWLSLIFIALMLIHIILHWKMITCIFKQMVSGKVSRTIIAILVAIISLFFALTPFFINPEVVPFEKKHINNHEISAAVKESVPDDKTTDYIDNSNLAKTEVIKTNKEKSGSGNMHDEIDVSGFMTLNEVAEKYSIPVNELTKALNIPAEASLEKIGRLKKRYEFEMEDLKDIIIKISEHR